VAWVCAVVATTSCAPEPDECPQACLDGQICFRGYCIDDTDAGDTGGDVEPDDAGEPDEAAAEDVAAEDVAADEGAGEVGPDDAGEDDVADDGPDEAEGGCTRTTDPLTLWTEVGGFDFTTTGPLTRMGSIDAACEVDGYRIKARRNMRLRFEGQAEGGSMLTVRLAVYDRPALTGGSATMLAEDVGAPGYTSILEVVIPADGEYLLVLHDLELNDPGGYALSARCLSGC
jgi:hypothetical protein